jgi:nicotinamide mononucleotide transporter
MGGMSWSEILGFVAGLASVWLYARQNVWAWPTGIANSAFWLILFFGQRLYLDASLQVVYLVLGVLGWVWWVRGQRTGAGREPLRVVRTPRAEAAVLAATGTAATAGLWWLMQRVGDSAPLPDSATTVLSLVAQYLLTRKRFGTWWCWITVDVANVMLYAYKHLYLTAALQPLFIALCIIGLRAWRASLQSSVEEPVPAVAG